MQYAYQCGGSLSFFVVDKNEIIAFHVIIFSDIL